MPLAILRTWQPAVRVQQQAGCRGDAQATDQLQRGTRDGDPLRIVRQSEGLQQTRMRIWIHHRALESVGDKAIITDEVTMAPQAPIGLIPGWGVMMCRVLFAFFTHRHRMLNRRLTISAAGE